MAAAGRHVRRSVCVSPHAYMLTSSGWHVHDAGKRRLADCGASRVAAAEVLAVAGADGGGSCGVGLVALTPTVFTEGKKKKKPDSCHHPLQ